MSTATRAEISLHPSLTIYSGFDLCDRTGSLPFFKRKNASLLVITSVFAR